MSRSGRGDDRKVVVIFGPTASGKSALALGLAERLGGEIINADSRQVYAGVSALTAGPTAAEREKVVQHLFGFLPVTETYSAAAWAAAAQECIENCWQRGVVPIVAGGTGFYLRVLMEGLNGVPVVPVEVTQRYGDWAVDRLWAELQRVDPEMAEMIRHKDEQKNRQRLVRALAVFEHTGVSLSEWQQRPGVPVLGADWRRIGVNLPVEELNQRIEKRWPLLMQQGVLDEVRALVEAGRSGDEPGLQALGFAGFAAHLRGKMTLPEAVAQVVQKDKQYAKRQRTWLRRQYAAALELAGPEVETAMAWLDT